MILLKLTLGGDGLFVLRGTGRLFTLKKYWVAQIEFCLSAGAARVYLHDIVYFINGYEYKIFVIKPPGVLPLDFSPFTENRYSYIDFLLA